MGRQGRSISLAMGTSDIASAAALSPVPSEASKRLLPWLVAVAFFMESLDTTILNTAVPAISEALQVTPLSMKAVLASYTLSLAVFIPISGWMADRFGTRRVFASAIGIFTLGSLLCGISSNIHLLVACRVLQGMGGAMMVPVGRLTLVRAFAKSELIRIMSFVAVPALVAPMLGPIAGGLIVGYLHWRVIFFLNIPIGIVGLVMVYIHLPDYREEKTPPLDLVGLILFGSGIALLSYVLEVFGEHTLSVREISSMLIMSCALLCGYWLHARGLRFPLLQLNLFRLRTFRAAVNGGLFTRLGIGGVPFLLPLLYQTGLGYTPIQSGLLIMPQAIAAMSMKAIMKRLLAAVGYRGVLVSNTIIIGVLLALFSTIGAHTPVWYIVILAFFYGGFTSLQYTSMNTLVYSDIEEHDTSAASTIASTMQQMAISFGVAVAGLTTAFFLPSSA
ncbi:MAG TPA: DHA2 family efflux MFS transporter permease subunit [Terracidiphilus sp.]|nr:DHA2 family efflux MFS transporter permease subunit [Terracidiphilus sp.]